VNALTTPANGTPKGSGQGTRGTGVNSVLRCHGTAAFQEPESPSQLHFPNFQEAHFAPQITNRGCHYSQIEFTIKTTQRNTVLTASLAFPF